MLAAQVAAQVVATPAAQAKEGDELLNTKVFFPHTNSYFELADGVPAGTPKGDLWRVSFNWGDAKKEATHRFHKGIQGRLAIVRDRETHEFLRKTFNTTGATWIGLRYMCSVKRLLWVDGEFYKRRDFSAWSRVWNVAGTDRLNNPHRSTCKGGVGDYLPIHYWAATFRWNANGYKKRYHRFFVEYPVEGQAPPEGEEKADAEGAAKAVDADAPAESSADTGDKKE
ncbi:MAG: C-type lectin domain-containing protein [Rhodobacterales bacterium]|nr:C-type lectin domain-containing protein [Rhodobacterales bacterium]